MKTQYRNVRWLALVLLAATITPGARAADDVKQPAPLPVLPWAIERMEERYTSTYDGQTPILPPIRQGEPLPDCDNSPTEQEVLRCLSTEIYVAVCMAKIIGNECAIACEKIFDKLDAPRFIPLVGPVQFHHGHWKCTVVYTESADSDFPFLYSRKSKRVQVVYLAKDHVHQFVGSGDVLETPKKNYELYDGSENLRQLCDEKSRFWPVGQSNGQWAAETPDLAFIPADAFAFVSVRASELITKLGIKGLADKPFLESWKAELGIPFDMVERWTVAAVGSDPAAAETVIIIRAARSMNRGDVLKACVPEAKEVKLHGKVCHVSSTTKRSVCFVSDQLLVVGSTEEVLAHSLKLSLEKADDKRAIEGVLKLADKHDIVAWCQASILRDAAHLPLPTGLETGTLTLDIGDQVALELRVSCADQASLRWTKKALQTGLNAAHMQFLMIPTMIDAAELFPSSRDILDIKQQMGFLPINLIRQTEKGLRKARVKVEGTTAKLVLNIPVNAKTLQTELTGMVKVLGADAGGKLCSGFGFPFFTQTPAAGMTLPSDRYLEHRPQYFPESTFPLVRDLAPQEERRSAPIAPTAPPANGIAPTPLRNVQGMPLAVPLPPTNGYAPQPVINTIVPVVATTVISEPSSVNPASVPSTLKCMPGSIKITVANVRKLPAQLFEMKGDGKSTFVQKIPAGEAVDLKLLNGQRYVAVFIDKPDSEPTLESYTPSQAESVWLLR